MVSRYGPGKQEGICLMAQPPHFRMMPPQRTDYHVGSQPQYQQQPNQSGNQGPAIRSGMQQTGPPNQASTPPNSEIKVQQMQQPMNLFMQQPVRGGATQSFYTPRGPPPQNQTPRMANHRQIPGQQQVFQTQSAAPYMQVQPVMPMYCTPYYGSTQRPMVQQFYQGQYATAVPYPQAPPPAQGYHYFIPRPQAPVGSAPQTLAQPQPPPAIAANINQNPQQQASQKKRRAKAIPIIDPDTGKDKLSEVYDEIESHPPSGESSARQTPQPIYIPNKEVQNAFTKQVNLVISQDKVDELDHSPQIPPLLDQHVVVVDTQAVYHSTNTAVQPAGRNDIVQYTTKLQVPTKEFVPGASVTSSPKEPVTPVVSANVDVPEMTIKPKDRESPAKVRKQREQQLPKEAKEVKEAIVPPAEKVPSKTAVEEQPKPKDVPLLSPVLSPVVPLPFNKGDGNKEVIGGPRGDDKKNNPKKDFKPETAKSSNPIQEVVMDNPGPVIPSVSPPLLPDSKSKQKSKDAPPKQATQQQPATQAGHKQSAAAPAPATVVPQSQPAKPNNKTSKMRELNMKGANKEGTDMDAFDVTNNTPIETVIVTNANANAANLANNNVVDNFTPEFESNKTMTTTTAPVTNNAPEVPPTIKAEAKPLPKARIDITDIVKDVPKPFVAPVEVVDETDRCEMSNDKIVQAKNEVNSSRGNSVSECESIAESKQSLPYKDDQWSPLNTAGKKVYDKDFLLALRNDPKSKKKPDNLLEVVVQEDRGRIGDINRYAIGGRATDFAPSFGASNYSGKSSSQRGPPPKRNSQQGKVSGNNKNSKPNIIRVSIREDVKLHESENAWRPARFNANAAVTEDEKKTEQLYKKVRGILNKLTPQKFDALLQQIRSLSIDTPERLQGVIDLVFEKAVDEPNFSVAYAAMCSQLALMQVPTNNKKEGEYVNFRKLLITRCQLEFEKNSVDETSRNEKIKEIEACTDAEKKKEMELILEEEDRRLRRKSVGNIRFIGELFKKQMLTNNIMMRCLDNLLNNKDKESLECLCKLLSTIGEELEKRKVSLEHIFNSIKEIADKKHGKVDSRVRFMLQDVIDLRAAKWVPRRQDSNPKTIDQIQKEANDEQLNIQAMNSGPHTPRKDERNSSSSANTDRKRRNNNNSDTDGWQTSQSRNARSTAFSVQSDKLKNKVPLIDEPLGSSNMFGQWGRGANLKTSAAPAPSVNMYAALDNIANDADKRNSMGGYKPKEPYSSKGPSLERSTYNKHYEDGRGSRSGSQHRSHDGSQRGAAPLPANIQTNIPKMPPPATAELKQTQPVEQMSTQQLELKLKNILEEYLNDCCTVAACDEDIRECIPASALSQLVSQGYNEVLERSKTARIRTATLFAQLIRMNTLPLESYCAGLEEVLEQADDLTIDIPKIWEYLAEIVAPLIYENTFPLKRLHASCNILISQGHAAKLLGPVFKLVVSEKGPNYLTSLWNSSELRFEDFMQAGDVEKFIKDNQLEFLVGGVSTSASQSALSFEQIHEKLLNFFENENPLDDISNWITVNVGDRVKDKQFIRVLATAVFDNSIVRLKLNNEILRKHYKLLLKYIDGNLEYELQLLYALQAHINKLEHPQGLLLNVFTILYDDSMLSHDCFVHWESSKDPAEQEGKGVALKQLTSFFTSLKEADEESSSSEDA